MPDREMVMNWLKELAEPDWKSFHSISEVQIVAQDALALLKEDCHNCKLECLLQRYDQLKEKYDKLLKKHEEREQRICKSICNFIRGACSTDTDDDKDFVCYEIQKCFTEGR